MVASSGCLRMPIRVLSRRSASLLLVLPLLTGSKARLLPLARSGGSPMEATLRRRDFEDEGRDARRKARSETTCG